MMIIFAGIGASSPEQAVFFSKCGQCHKTGGSAPVFAPTKYATSQWERFFARDQHKRKKDISQMIGAKDMEIIKKYLVDHAADSTQPEASGLK